MAIKQSFPSINDIACSWSDIAITFTVAGGLTLTVEDISAIKWSRKVDVGVQKGTSGGRVMARTTGEGSQEASATFYRSGLGKLEDALSAVAPQRGNQRVISAVGFDILIQHTPLGSTQIFTTKIKGCRYLGDSDDMKEGSDADQIEVTLNPIEIVRIKNGVEIVLL
jgi:hypothetical protein